MSQTGGYMKVLKGVEHENQEELEEVIQELSRYSWATLGLELPTDYETRRQFGVAAFFFGGLEQYAKKRKARVFPLESPSEYDYMQALEIAKAVRDGRVSEETLVQNIEQVKTQKSPYVAPEQSYVNNHFLALYEKAHEILTECHSLDTILALCLKSYGKREQTMITNIRKDLPDIVVIGSGHAQNIIGCLPEYTLV